MPSSVVVEPSLALDRDRAAGAERADALVGDDLAGLHEAGEALPQPVDDLLLAGLAHGEVDDGLPGLDPELLGPGDVAVDGRRLEELLGRDAAPVQAGAADLVLLDDARPEPGRRPRRGPRRSRPGHRRSPRDRTARPSEPPPADVLGGRLPAGERPNRPASAAAGRRWRGAPAATWSLVPWKNRRQRSVWPFASDRQRRRAGVGACRPAGSTRSSRATLRLLNTAQPLAGSRDRVGDRLHLDGEGDVAARVDVDAGHRRPTAARPTVRWPTCGHRRRGRRRLRAGQERARCPPAIRMASPHSRAVRIRRRVLTRRPMLGRLTPARSLAHSGSWPSGT